MLSSDAVANARFPVVRWRVGYEIDEVTRFLDQASETLRAYEAGERSDRAMSSETAAGSPRSARFNLTKFREGWDVAAVNDFVRQIVQTLRAHETPAP